MAKDVVITPASGLIDFKNASNVSVATISLSDTGQLSLGNTASNVYIGDGTTSVDIIFEQNGKIRALTGKTLTFGQSDSNLNIAAPMIYTSPDASKTITATMLNAGSLSFSGSAGQLFSVTNSFTGTIFSANDVSGIPSIEVLDTGLVKLAQYGGNVLIGTGTDDGTNNLQVASAKISSSLVLPTTSTLPASPVAGNLRFNNSTSKFEGHNGTAWGDIGGGATITNNTSTNASYYLGMSSATSGSWSTAYTSNTKLYFNPSTGTLYSTLFQSLSDETAKENIVTITNSLLTVNQLNGVEFTWKDNGKPSAGVIAQQLENILPALVATGDDGLKSVNYLGIIGYLIEAVKELTAKFEQLENK